MSSEIEAVQPFIRYSNTVDDLVAFSEFHCFRSLEGKKKRRKQIRIWATALALLGLILGYNIFLTTSLGFLDHSDCDRFYSGNIRLPFANT